jgi:hypothetical protein
VEGFQRVDIPKRLEERAWKLLLNGMLGMKLIFIWSFNFIWFISVLSSTFNFPNCARGSSSPSTCKLLWWTFLLFTLFYILEDLLRFSVVVNFCIKIIFKIVVGFFKISKNFVSNHLVTHFPWIVMHTDVEMDVWCLITLRISSLDSRGWGNLFI